MYTNITTNHTDTSITFVMSMPSSCLASRLSIKRVHLNTHHTHMRAAGFKHTHTFNAFTIKTARTRKHTAHTLHSSHSRSVGFGHTKTFESPRRLAAGYGCSPSAVLTEWCTAPLRANVCSSLMDLCKCSLQWLVPPNKSN